MSAPNKAGDVMHCYIARCRCGCGSLVAATIDAPERAKNTADFVAELVRDGYVVERVLIDDARAAKWLCAAKVTP